MNLLVPTEARHREDTLMKRKRLSKDQRRDIAALAGMKDSEIDLTNVPEVLDWRGAKVGGFFRKNQTNARVQAERRRKRIRKA
jgi:hypothetical protein